MDSQFFITAYKRYRKLIDKTEWFSSPLPYDWVKLPSEISAEFFLYCKMLKSHANVLANDINQLLRDTVKLRVWSEIIEQYNEQEKFYLIIEFIEHIAFSTLNLPYAIRSRFIFSATHLCHQANRVLQSNWKDDLCNDRSINYKHMKNKCTNWKSYSSFEKALNSISDEKFNSETIEFRNRFHHRLPQTIEIGLSNLLNRSKNDDGSVSYGFGGRRPLQVKKLIPLFEEQMEKASLCFLAYQDLINEQLKSIFDT
jgi:hypothetical protein